MGKVVNLTPGILRRPEMIKVRAMPTFSPRKASLNNFFSRRGLIQESAVAFIGNECVNLIERNWVEEVIMPGERGGKV